MFSRRQLLSYPNNRACGLTRAAERSQHAIRVATLHGTDPTLHLEEDAGEGLADYSVILVSSRCYRLYQIQTSNNRTFRAGSRLEALRLRAVHHVQQGALLKMPLDWAKCQP